MEAQEVQAVRRSGIKKNGLVKTARTYWGYIGGHGASGHSTSYQGISAVSGGGGGGGAAVGNNGSDGESPEIRGTNFDTPSYQGYGYIVSKATGGAGADATIVPATSTVPGTGGGGGHGGGGGGGGGIAQATSIWGCYGGDGGIGSNGGDGAPGCVLIYYRLPKTLSVSGAVHDKNGKIISDKYGRRLVV